MAKPGEIDKLTSPKLRGERRRVKKKLRLLVVDDEHGILEILKSALSLLGNFDVSIADSAATALKQINRASTPFDLLLFDIQMPEMNGITLCEKVRKTSPYEETPIIMLTAMTDRKFVDDAFMAGATDYVTKPFDFLELRSRLLSAERLVAERKKTNAGLAVARKYKAELAANEKVSLDDPVAIDGVERVLRFNEFDNYFLQLSQSRLFSSFATAVKIDDAKEMHASMSSGGFRRALHDVASGLSDATKRSGEVICYRGSGVFLCISHGRRAAKEALSEGALNQLVLTLQAQRQAKQHVRVRVGDPVLLRSLTKSGALIALNSAFNNVAAPDQSTQNTQAPVDVGVKTDAERQDNARMPRGGYESVLRDMLQYDFLARRKRTRE